VAFPRETIDAVIIHELAHLTHANHSKRFWDLVYTWMPNYEEHVKILKKSLPNGSGEIE
jgi:predicted metal-dependent hydrolase